MQGNSVVGPFRFYYYYFTLARTHVYRVTYYYQGVRAGTEEQEPKWNRGFRSGT